MKFDSRRSRERKMLEEERLKQAKEKAQARDRATLAVSAKHSVDSRFNPQVVQKLGVAAQACNPSAGSQRKDK